jgi:Protein phosphatase 2C
MSANEFEPLQPPVVETPTDSRPGRLVYERERSPRTENATSAEQNPTEVGDVEGASDQTPVEGGADASGADEEQPDAVPATEDWSGEPLLPYSVGEPGRAATEVTADVSENPVDPADTQLDAATYGSLTVRAASSRGTSHRHSGTPRQDEYAVCRTDSWLIAAVADGVSAGWLSHQAAAIACRGAATLARDKLAGGCELAAVPWEEILADLARRIIGHGQRQLIPEDGDEEVSPEQVARAMATTLVVLVMELEEDANGQRHGVALPLGDTSVFQLSPGGDWRSVTAIKNEGAAISTSAVMALPYLPRELPRPLLVTVDRGEALFVMTDGVGDPLGDGSGSVGRFLSTVWRVPPDLFSFGAQTAFARRSYDDDRTVIGIWAGE